MSEPRACEQRGEPQSSAGERSNGLFREEALTYLAAPDQIDTLMRVTTLRSWLALLALGAVVGLVLLWSVFGRIPMTVTGRGVLIRPGKVVGLQSTAAGQMQSLHVHEGDYIDKGTVVGVIDQVSLRQQLELERSRLARQQAEYTAIADLQERREALANSLLRLRREDLQQRMRNTQSLADRLNDASTRSVQQQRENLTQALELSRTFTKLQKERLETVQKLRVSSAGSQDEVKREKMDYLQALSREIELQGHLQQLDLRARQVEDDYLQKTDKISEMKSQVNDTLVEAKRLEQQTLELTASHKLALQETQRNIARLELALEKQGNIISEHSGRVLEITAAVGQVLSPGTKIATVLQEDQSSPLVCFCYFQVKDGKRIAPGMRAHLALDSVQRERYGSLVSRVQSITPFPVSREAVVNTVGNSEVARGLVGEDRQMEAVSELEVNPSTPSGYAWTSSRGPGSKVTAGTTANVEVEVESRSPISFLLPFLREWAGSY
jgi:HlyD family secretion protein